MFLADKLILDSPRRTKDGYMAVRAKAARTGTYTYAGHEIDPNNDHGLRDQAKVNVLRDEQTVFDEASARSFVGKPITDDHPTEAVTANNWKDHARGMVMGAMRDGDYLAFDLLLTDAGAITKVNDGKRELSNGYGAELEFGDFTAPDGTACAARQTRISGNHVAIVDQGRAGSECRIGDAACCEAAPGEFLRMIVDHLLTDERTYQQQSDDGNNSTARRETSNSQPGAPRRDGEAKMPHVLMIDGLQVPNVSDEAKAAIEKLQGQLRDANAALDAEKAKVATLTTDKATLDAKVTTLEKQAEDSKLTPQQLRDAAKAYQQTVDKAKALGITVTDAMDEPAIMKAVVAAKIGDAAKDWDQAQIAASFATLTKDAKPADPVRQALADGVRPVNDDGRAVVQTLRSARYS